MLKIKSKTPTPPPVEEEVVEEQPLEIKVYMDYIGEEGYVYKYSKEKGKYYKSSICLMGPKGNPGIRGPKGDPGAGADVDLSQYASKSYVDNKISDLINNAPEVLNTLGELATKVGDLMPLHGNTGDVDGFKLSYINGENADPAVLELYKAMSALNYNNDNPTNSIVLSTLNLDTSSLSMSGSAIVMNSNGNITILSAYTPHDLSNATSSLITLQSDSITITTDSLSRKSSNNSNSYIILDGSNTKTINGQELFWDGTGEKNIELVTKTELEETEEVIATALTDLDTRVNNSIKSVKVNGTALTPDANKAVDISVPPGSFILDIVIDPESEDVTVDNNQVSGYMAITTTDLDIFTAIDNAYNEGKNIYVKIIMDGGSLQCSFEGKETFNSNVTYRFNNFYMEDRYYGMYYLTFIGSNGLITIYIFLVTIPEKYKIINHGTNDTGTSNSPYQLTFNNMHVWSTVTSLNLSLQVSPNDDVVEYMFEFTSGSTPTTLSLPNSIVWADSCGVLTVEANKKYLISIMNGIGVWCSVSTT